METAINTLISTLVGLVIGTLVNKIRQYKNKAVENEKNNDKQNKALKNLLKSNMTNQFYVYEKIGKAPRNVKQSWYDMFESYVELGGNTFIKDDLKPKWDKIESEEEK